MPSGRDRAWVGLLARYAVFIVVLGLVATSTYAAVDAEDRPTVLRLAVAAFVAVVLIHVQSHLRRPPEGTEPSAFERARRGEPAETKIAPAIVRLQKQVEYCVASRRYFDDRLWPSLVQLAEERGTRQQLHEPPPARRWLRRRGPSLAAIAELVRRVEGR